jgi:uncharacterized protein (TIGR02265 family)
MKRLPGKLVDGVFRKVLAQDMTPALSEALRNCGLDLASPTPSEVEVTVWNQCIDVTAQALFPEEAEPTRVLGRHILASLESRGFVKGPWLSVARLMGPRRALRQAAQFVEKDKNSPLKLQLRELAANVFEVTAHDAQQPAFLAGLLEGVVLGLKGKNAKAELASFDAATAVFRLSWS